MTLHVNGKPVNLEAGASVVRLIEPLELGKKRIAVEVNRALLVR